MSILTIFRITLAFEQHRFNVDAIWLSLCSYDNSTIYSVNKLKQYDASLLLFPSFTFLSFTFLFNLFFKFMSNMSKSRFIESHGH